MTRAKRSDSLAAIVEAAQAVGMPEIEPPAHVTVKEGSIPFWRAIIASRARAEWSKCDLVVAAQLARCQYDIEQEAIMLEAEGSVLRNDRGTQVMNPRHSVLQQLAVRQMSLMRGLSMAGVVGNGRKEDLGKKRQLERDASEIRDEQNADDLLA